MKNLRFFIVSLVLAVALGAGVYLMQRSDVSCSTIYRSDKIIKSGNKAIVAEVADSPAEQTRGLSGRDCIGDNQGMLFVNDKPGRYGFWMKDMNFPIDMAWIAADKKVVKIQSNVSPGTYPQTFTNEEPAQYILELKAGGSNRLGIKKDTQLTF